MNLAERLSKHAEMVNCPEEGQWSSREPECFACQLLVKLEAALPQHPLRALAKAATPGPWIAEEVQFPHNYVVKHSKHSEYTVATTHQEPADAIYIAAVDPQTILALLDRIEELEA